uniref:DUF19 domain-containing protein n=1 Tax=Caenorhabditis tropicalis TaxID=1561998 RepID=A0A1I7UW46_9PELO
MKALSLFLALLIPIASASNRPLCVFETHASCRPEITEMNLVGRKLNSSYYPPLTDALRKYDRRCGNVMVSGLGFSPCLNSFLKRCASRLECFTDKPIEEVYKTSCYPIGQKEYDFDECIRTTFMKITSGRYKCIKKYEFMTKNGTLNKKAFFSLKNCILWTAEENCEYEYADFFKENYGELMSLYTTKPEVDNGLCNSPYDKFYKIQCEMVEEKAWKWEKKLSLDRNEVMNKEIYLSSCREAQVCLFEGWGSVCDNWESTFTEIEKIFEERPYLLEFECLQNADYDNFFVKIYNCLFDSREDCVISQVAEICNDEVIEHFKKSLVANKGVPSVEEGSGGN